jgi:hypothetical protein
VTKERPIYRYTMPIQTKKRVSTKKRLTERKRIVRTTRVIKLVSWEVMSDSIPRVRSHAEENGEI